MMRVLVISVMLVILYVAVVWYQQHMDVSNMPLIRPGGVTLRPGARYSVGGKVYTFESSSVPQHRFYSSTMQPESVIIKSRELTSRVFGALGDRVWLAGTSLMSFVHGGTVSPIEHILYVHMMFSDRNVLFSSEMHTRCRAQFGLEINLRRGVESGRHINITMLEDVTSEVVVRVSFVADAGHGTLAVVTSWDDDAVESCKRRRWPRDWIVPTSSTMIDDINVNIPAKPEYVLFKEFND